MNFGFTDLFIFGLFLIKGMLQNSENLSTNNLYNARYMN